MRSLLVIPFVLATVACQTTAMNDKPITASLKNLSPIERTWILGQQRLPASLTKSGKDELLFLFKDPANWSAEVESELSNAKERIPVAVFLHGCSGITRDNLSFFRLLNEEGWAVFAPDSFARPGRTRTCTHRSFDTMDNRIEEARYALARLMEARWADKSRIILVGQSEGGEAAGLWSYEGFAAIISTGADCQDSNGRSFAPISVPFLSLVGEKDTSQHPPCSVSGRSGGSKSLIIPEADHQVYTFPAAKQEIRQFLGACCSEK